MRPPTTRSMTASGRPRRRHGASRRNRAGATMAPLPSTDRTSPRVELVLLPGEARDLDRPQELDLRFELDAEALVRAPPAFGDEIDCVAGAGFADVLDEVRMLRGNPRPADSIALQAAQLEHPAGG